MFEVIVHYYETNGDESSSSAPTLETCVEKFANEATVRSYVEEEIQWESTEMVECAALNIREYGVYSATRKRAAHKAG